MFKLDKHKIAIIGTEEKKEPTKIESAFFIELTKELKEIDEAISDPETSEEDIAVLNQRKAELDEEMKMHAFEYTKKETGETKETVQKEETEKIKDNEEEQRKKQDEKDYPVIEVDNEEYTLNKAKEILETMADSDPRKESFKKKIEEVEKVGMKKEADKDLNKKIETPINKEDEIEEKHPKLDEPPKEGEEEEIPVLDYKKVKGRIKAVDKVNILDKLEKIKSTLLEYDSAFPETGVATDVAKEAEQLINLIKTEGIEAKVKADDMIVDEGIIEEPLGPENPDEMPQEDIFDVGEGLAIGNGMMAHKDEETGQIYVLDKNGDELLRMKNAFVNDMALVIEAFRDLLGLESEAETNLDETPVLDEEPIGGTATDDSEKEGIDRDEEDLSREDDEEEEEDNAPDDELIKKVDELIDVEKEQGQALKEVTEEVEEEELPDMTNEKLSDLKKQIEKKKQKVASAINFMIDNDKIPVNAMDINRNRVVGESVIFAKQRAKKSKSRQIQKVLLATPDEMIDMLIESMKNGNSKEEKNIFTKIFK